MWNIKFRLYLIVIFTTLPLILYVAYSHYEKIQIQNKNILDHLTEIADLAAAEHGQINEGARQLLIAISTNPDILNSNEKNCNYYLSNLKKSYVRYLNFGVINQAGSIICAADTKLAISNPPNPKLIKDTLSTQTFTVGSYFPIKPDGAVINFGYPLSKGMIIYASLSLDWVSDFTNNFNDKDNNFVINILDKDGTVLARSPKTDAAVGQNFASDPLVKEIIKVGHGQTTKLGIDQVSRLYAFTSLDENRTTYVAVGISQKDIFASLKKAIITDTLIIITIIILSFLLTQKLGQILILKQIEELRKIDKLKDEFVSLASHQIRSPLTAIRWLSESILESKPSLTAKKRKSMVKIYETSLRLITLTSNLLSISRLEAGGPRLNLRLVPLRKITEPIITELSPLSSVTSNKIIISIPQSLKLLTDAVLLGEILKILLGNAIKYSTPSRRIYLSGKKDQKHIIITVKNTGIPVPDSFKSHIFTRFSRADNARIHSPDGNGLGLYLAKLITTKLRGTLSYTSDKKVTTFTLILPNEVR